ncbi:hypothetical protein KY334_01835, partial [Candidatus Woesearchaeota archaeon]|nr:hypothetical protein [Candidatus Woesearchaeota archaeon]
MTLDTLIKQGSDKIMSKKTLIFDNEWVLVKNDWDYVAREFSETFNTQLMKGSPFKKSLQVKKDGVNILQAYSRGDVDSNKFWEVVFEGYGISYSEDKAKVASNIFSKLT